MKEYRIPLSNVPAGANPVEWAASFCNANNSIIPNDDGFIYVTLDGICTAPGVEDITPVDGGGA